MASTTITPPASAPAAPQAPATPAPVTPTPTPAPVTSPVTTPAAPQTLEERLSTGWDKAKASVPLEEAEELTPEIPELAETPEITAAPATEETTTVVPGEETTGETAETPELPEKADVEKVPAVPEFVLDDSEAGDPQLLAKELKADPGAQKFFDDRPELKNQVFAALRRDAET